MTTEILAFATAVSHVTNIAKAAIQARDESKRNEALTELNGALAELTVRHLEIAQKQQALLEQNEDLKNKIVAYDKWEQEKTRYRLENVGAGAIVRSLNPAHAAGEPLHWLCPHCYESRKKGFFQSHGRTYNHYKCATCGAEIQALESYPSAS